jgi:hypothetical protein
VKRTQSITAWCPPVSSLSTLQIYIPLSPKTTMYARVYVCVCKAIDRLNERPKKKKKMEYTFLHQTFFCAHFSRLEREREKKREKICHVGNVAVIKMFSPPTG